MLNKNANTNYCKYYCLKITSILYMLIFLSLLLTIIIIKTSTLNQIFNISPNNNSWQFYSLKIYLILIFILFLIASVLWVAISFKTDWILAIKDNLFLSFLLVILTINFYGCFFIIKIINNTQNNNFDKKRFWIKFKNKLGIKQWLTVDYVLIALFCALTLLFTYFEELILPRMFYGGGIALKYIPLIIISFTTSFLGGWLTGFISALMALLFIPASNIISPWSFLLDYFLAMTTPAIVAILPFKLNDKSIFIYINYFFHCFLVLLVIYFWQFLSGYFVWTTVFPTSVWGGYSAILYSLVYNFIHIFIFTYPIIQIIIPILYRSLGNYYLNRYH